MDHRLLAAVAATVGLYAGASSASVYGDDLGRCVVASTTEKDRGEFMQWFFTTMSASPAVSGLTTVTPAQRLEHAHEVGRLMDRLMLQDCHKETVAALKYEGLSAIQSAFGLFGQVAVQGLMSDPKVAAEMAHITDTQDRSRWDALLKEAGLPAAAPAK